MSTNETLLDSPWPLGVLNRRVMRALRHHREQPSKSTAAKVVHYIDQSKMRESETLKTYRKQR